MAGLCKRRHVMPKRGATAAFINSTWEMMNDPSSTSAIEWSEDGARIVVRDSWALANNVLPKFFKHNRYASWVRALNAYPQS